MRNDWINTLNKKIGNEIDYTQERASFVSPPQQPLVPAEDFYNMVQVSVRDAMVFGQLPLNSDIRQ